jgi:phage repressor protein C with HTH and peptisase S24 domain
VIRLGPLAIDLLRSGRPVRFRAIGTSMCPTIRPGDTLVVEPVALAAIRRGDVVLYEIGGHLRAHRVVGIWRTGADEPSLLLRGDNHASCDRPLPAGAVLGRVAAVERSTRRRSAA